MQIPVLQVISVRQQVHYDVMSQILRIIPGGNKLPIFPECLMWVFPIDMTS